MQFKNILVVSVLAVSASANPMLMVRTTGSGETCTASGGTAGVKACCLNGILNPITCLIGLCLPLGGGANACCAVNQNGLINVGIPCIAL